MLMVLGVDAAHRPVVFLLVGGWGGDVKKQGHTEALKKAAHASLLFQYMIAYTRQDLDMCFHTVDFFPTMLLIDVRISRV